MRLAPAELARRLKPSLEAAGLWRDEYLGDRHAWFFSVLELFRPRMKRLEEFVPQSRFFFVDSLDFDAAAVTKHLRVAGMREHLLALDAAFSSLATFDVVSTEEALRKTAEARGVKAGSLIHAVRVAVTGKSVSPGLFEVLALVGRDTVRARLQAAAVLAVSPTT
jgi:glutamyl/glutaminyl-tRNA synthetase